MVISLRGTNGSGKSTVIRALFKQGSAKPIYGALGPRLPEAYALTLPKCSTAFVLGPYVTECGGCDRLIPYELILELIEKYSKRGHVLLEGMIVTSVYGRVGKLMERWKKDSVFVFLDTSLEECIRRIEARRGYSGDERLHRNVKAKFETSMRIKQKVITDDIMRVITVSSDKAPQAVLKLLRG